MKNWRLISKLPFLSPSLEIVNFLLLLQRCWSSFSCMGTLVFTLSSLLENQFDFDDWENTAFSFCFVFVNSFFLFPLLPYLPIVNFFGILLCSIWCTNLVKSHFIEIKDANRKKRREIKHLASNFVFSALFAALNEKYTTTADRREGNTETLPRL